MAVVRVPPSAASTSQSTQRVRGPSASQVDRRTNAASDQALDFGAASIDPALGDVARFAVERRVGQHRILRRDPAAGDFLLLHPARNILLHHDSADDLGAPTTGEDRSGGMRRDAGFERNGAKLIGTASVVAAG